MLSQLLDVFKSLQEHDVHYVVIGGIAAILHGIPSAPFDLDVLIEATPQNAQRLLDALLDSRLGTAALTSAENVVENEITIFNDRVRIDVQTSTPGIEFTQAWANRQTMTYRGQTFYVITLSDLIASKVAAGRAIDLEDVRLLRGSDKGSDA